MGCPLISWRERKNALSLRGCIKTGEDGEILTRERKRIRREYFVIRDFLSTFAAVLRKARWEVSCFADIFAYE